MNMRKRMMRGIEAQAITRILGLCMRIILPPLFIAAWGVDLYGEWIVMTSLVAYLAVSDLGSQLYISNRLTQAYAQRDFRAFRSILHTGMVFYLFLGGGILLAFVALLWATSPQVLFHVTLTSSRTAFIVLAIMAFQLCLSLPYALLWGVYRATMLLPRSIMFSNLISLLQIIGTVIVLRTKGGMVVVAVIQVVPVLLVMIASVYDLRRLRPDIETLSVASANREAFRSFVRPSLHFFWIQIAQMASMQGILLILGYIFQARQVTIYATTRTVVNTILSVNVMVTLIAWPEFTRLDAQGSRNQLMSLYRVTFRTQMAIAGLVGIALHFFGNAIFKLWLGPAVPFNQNLMDIMLVGAIVSTFWMCCRNVLMAVNKQSTVSAALGLGAVLGLILGFVGGRQWGLEGAASGLLLADLAIPVWKVPAQLMQFSRSFTETFFVLELIVPLAAFVVSFLYLPGSIVAAIALIVWLSKRLPVKRSLLDVFGFSHSVES